MPRVRFQEELRRLTEETVSDLELAVEAVDDVVEVLSEGDAGRAEAILARDEELDRRYATLQDDLLSLIALQAPVARDLRLVSALMHVSRFVERIGDQCVNIAKLSTVAGPDPPGAASLRALLVEMAVRARDEVREAAEALRTQDVERARRLDASDREVNRLNRQAFEQALALGDDAAARGWAMTVVLVARALERVGDNAVDVASQVVFVVTGRYDGRGGGRPPPAAA